MKLIYMDESGTGLNSKDFDFFVIAACCIDTSEVSQINAEVSSLKRRWITWMEAEDWEI